MDIGDEPEFDWGAGNREKNEKHGVSFSEIEQVFLNAPLLVAEDRPHSQAEERWHALGRTNADRRLHVTFTIRGRSKKVRPISARPMDRKEREAYAKKVEEDSVLSH